MPRGRKTFKQVRCAHRNADGVQCPNITSVIAVTGKTLCDDCSTERMNIYRRGDKPVINANTG